MSNAGRDQHTLLWAANEGAGEERQSRLYGLGGKEGKKGLRPLVKVRQCRRWAAAPLGTHVVAITREGGLVLHWPEERRTVKHKTSSIFTCVACHPTESCVATGDVQGVISLWYQLENAELTPACTIMHWHAHAVADLVFNSDGSYLVSGGEEGVLVIWQTASGNKRFLPRLGAPIRRVSMSSDDLSYGLCLADNTFKAFDVLTLGLLAQLSGIKTDPPQQRPSRVGRQRSGGANQTVRAMPTVLPALCMREPKSDLLVLRGLQGWLQFFNTATDTLAYELNVTERVYISRTDERRPLDADISHAAFCSNGQWLATAEHWVLSDARPELRIKFWSESPGAVKYVLNTAIDSAHTEPITGLAMHPTEKLAVSCSADGRFKAWTHRAASSKGEGSHWACLYVGSHNDLPCTSCSISPDGSLLAVVFNNEVSQNFGMYVGVAVVHIWKE